jgi:hypothetical protein
MYLRTSFEATNKTSNSPDALTCAYINGEAAVPYMLAMLKQFNWLRYGILLF